MPAVLWILLGLAQRFVEAFPRPSCDVGFAYSSLGRPHRTQVVGVEACREECSMVASCMRFTYDKDQQYCWLLNATAQLEWKADAVSGVLDCVMPEPEPVEDEESDTGRAGRILLTLQQLCSIVEERSDDMEMRAMAKHMRWAAKEGLIGEESYEDISEVIAASSDLSTFQEMLDGMENGNFMLTEEDLAWLLQNSATNGTHPETVEAEKNSFLLRGTNEHNESNITVCQGRACDQLSGTGRFGAGKPWPNAEVKYCFDINIAPKGKKLLKQAMAAIRRHLPGIGFLDVGYRGDHMCNQNPAVFFQTQPDGCWSNIGVIEPSMWYRIGLSEGNQILNLQIPGCGDRGTAIHELLHTLGMAEEQNRPDRDKYLEIFWENIKKGEASNFWVDFRADTNRVYDIMSIMHYRPRQCSWNGKDTFRVKDAGYLVYTSNARRFKFFRPGQRLHMSNRDVEQLAQLYKCVARSRCMQPMKTKTDAPTVHKDELMEPSAAAMTVDGEDNGEVNLNVDFFDINGNPGLVIGIIGVAAVALTAAFLWNRNADESRSLLAQE